MKLTVLVDNNTLIDRYFLAEPGFSAYIEDGDARVLFDAGYSDIFIRNAAKAGVDLGNLDFVALSHGHLDHTWGLEPLAMLLTERQIEKRPFKRPVLVAHPRLFESAREPASPEIGPLFSERKAGRHFSLALGVEPRWLTPNLVWLGEIPRLNSFEGKLSFGWREGESDEDRIPDDSALAYRSKAGLVVVTGCAHAGVCNTIEYAKKICGESRVADVIGGFHLQEPTAEHLQGTIAYFRDHPVAALHACHCTDLRSKIALAAVANVVETGSGLSLTFD